VVSVFLSLSLEKKMPKLAQYEPGAFVYFQGDKGDKIFVLQSGAVDLITKNMQTGVSEHSLVQMGELIGVKSALGQSPREESASVVKASNIMIFTVEEFEGFALSHPAIIIKMLKVFSKQLRGVNKELATVLKQAAVDTEDEIFTAAEIFLRNRQQENAHYVYHRYSELYPQGKNIKRVMLQLNSFIQNRVPVITHFDNAATEDTFKNGEIIFVDGEPGDCFYMIQNGQVVIVKVMGNSQKTLSVLHKGELFGEMAMLENSPRSASAVAVGETKLKQINKENFDLLLTSRPQIAIQLLKTFVGRIYDAKRRFLILTLDDTHARVADVFLMLDELSDLDAKEQKIDTRTYNTTTENIARWSGLTLSQAQEELNYFQKNGQINQMPGKIVVKNISYFNRYVATVRAKNYRSQTK
jgi:CRP-like cAMP-binding protein